MPRSIEIPPLSEEMLHHVQLVLMDRRTMHGQTEGRPKNKSLSPSVTNRTEIPPTSTEISHHVKQVLMDGQP